MRYLKGKYVPYYCYSVFCFIILAVCCPSCANIVPPSGGPKDLTPPKLLSESPKDSSLGKAIYKITLHFNKFMEVHDLNKNLITAPLLPTNPTVMVYGKRVEIKLPDSSLKPNTTYRIALGNALTDNRERTPYANFVYLFSTGNYFDSLKLSGAVKDAQTGLPDSSASIFLYPDSSSDSAVIREHPEYVQKVDGSGHFAFSNLPNKSFKVYAVSDKDNNHIYTIGEEKIDFLDSLTNPSAHPATLLQFALFKEQNKDTAATGQTNKKSRLSGKKQHAKSKISYQVMVDTVSKKMGTFDISKTLTIKLFRKIKTIDSERVFLSYSDKGLEVEAIRQLKYDSSTISLNTDWKPETTYTLRLVKGWATDTSGAELPPGKYTFRTKSLSDYATLNINIASNFVGKQFLLELLKDNKQVWQQAALNSKTTIPLLAPGTYTLRLIIDKNKNGKWDTGDLFAKKHAEQVIPYSGKIILKPGWTNDVDFKQKIPEASQKAELFSGNKQSDTEEK